MPKTKKIPIFQVDAFANRHFQGNPAAVCPLEKWLPTEIMQQIARENNLSETAFFVSTELGYQIRWFTPTCEVDLCGHATLASAYVLFFHLDYKEDEITFYYKHGLLKVRKSADNERWLELDLPVENLEEYTPPPEVLETFLNKRPVGFKGQDYMLVFNNENDIATASPNMDSLKSIELRGLTVTAPSKTYDFVCRFFAPKVGIDEDSVTGSIFTYLVPYWAKKLQKKELFAKQISERGGEVKCRFDGEYVTISGQVALYMVGKLFLKLK
jgi:PhzF family phenazine biosynthesis protein